MDFSRKVVFDATKNTIVPQTECKLDNKRIIEKESRESIRRGHSLVIDQFTGVINKEESGVQIDLSDNGPVERIGANARTSNFKPLNDFEKTLESLNDKVETETVSEINENLADLQALVRKEQLSEMRRLLAYERGAYKSKAKSKSNRRSKKHHERRVLRNALRRAGLPEDLSLTDIRKGYSGGDLTEDVLLELQKERAHSRWELEAVARRKWAKTVTRFSGKDGLKTIGQSADHARYAKSELRDNLNAFDVDEGTDSEEDDAMILSGTKKYGDVWDALLEEHKSTTSLRSKDLIAQASSDAASLRNTSDDVLEGEDIFSALKAGRGITRLERLAEADRTIVQKALATDNTSLEGMSHEGWSILHNVNDNKLFQQSYFKTMSEKREKEARLQAKEELAKILEEEGILDNKNSMLPNDSNIKINNEVSDIDDISGDEVDMNSKSNEVNLLTPKINSDSKIKSHNTENLFRRDMSTPEANYEISTLKRERTAQQLDIFAEGLKRNALIKTSESTNDFLDRGAKEQEIDRVMLNDKTLNDVQMPEIFIDATGDPVIDEFLLNNKKDEIIKHAMDQWTTPEQLQPEEDSLGAAEYKIKIQGWETSGMKTAEYGAGGIKGGSHQIVLPSGQTVQAAPNVILSQPVSRINRTAVPLGFTSASAFNEHITRPIGPEWLKSAQFISGVAPKVLLKKGQLIAPLTSISSLPLDASAEILKGYKSSARGVRTKAKL